LRHAVAKGTQRALVRALYEAYFFEGRNIGDKSELAAIAAGHGFTRDEALALLDDPEELRATLGEAETTARQGITGVPFFIFDQKLALSGAQPVSVMQQAISQALEEESAAAG
jgi:predicted DsbA family dithiol-disulfide isomerase